MAIALRSLAIAALGLFLLPASALADAEVAWDATNRILTVNDDFNGAVGDRITISQTATTHVITMNTTGQSLFNTTSNCLGAGSMQITCGPPTATSIAVDMKAGNDRVTV